MIVAVEYPVADEIARAIVTAARLEGVEPEAVCEGGKDWRLGRARALLAWRGEDETPGWLKGRDNRGFVGADEFEEASS